ncbi:MAG: argininosuccinate lyase [Acidimicrobiales bacterium]|nr:MAG: argininosuccinate lyase [marine actinobacterium MedAcidi-G1]|tara:strand:+ start:10429 stop:11811 length:1383 start_codon:yes stop_codon:yes gene_type:complete
MGTLWEGRLSGETTDALKALNDSLEIDKRLYKEDILGSMAHVEMLASVGLIEKSDRALILDALRVTEEEIASGSFVFQAADEDIHTAVERRVIEIAGAAGARMHTGRSRNDQVVTDLRLWTLKSLDGLAALIVSLQKSLIEQAEKADETRLPGYTHLQQAQPVLLSHHLLAHAWALSRDFDRIIETRSRTDVSPLGAGALAGSSLPIDPIMTSEYLGFSETFKNSLDAVSDRDFVAEAIFVNALLAVHLSRIGEELVLWSSEEFGFVDIDDEYTTGSSMLPQKKNPDIAELARGKTGRIIGNLAGILTVLKGLPLTYNKDLQEDKEPLFDSFDTNSLVLTALTGIFDSVVFNKEKMSEATDKPFSMAIDLAEYLVHKGMPFREAHTMVGGLVKASIDSKKDFKKLVMEDDNFGSEIENFFIPEMAIKRRITPGSTGLEAVEVQKEQIKKRLEIQTSMISR